MVVIETSKLTHSLWTTAVTKLPLEEGKLCSYSHSTHACHGHVCAIYNIQVALVRPAMTVRLLVFLSFASYAIQQSNPVAHILIYSATAGFRHDSIPTAISALEQAGQQNNIQFDNTEDKSLFNNANLVQYDAILFLSTTGEGMASTNTITPDRVKTSFLQSSMTPESLPFKIISILGETLWVFIPRQTRW